MSFLAMFDNKLFYGFAIFCAVFVLGYFFQGRLLYYNTTPPGSNQYYPIMPSYFGLEHEDLWISTEDEIKLNCWLVYRGSAPSPTGATIVYFHGNAGNMAGRLEVISKLIDNVGDVNVLMVSYRGYGLSEGSPTQAGLQEDARSVWRYLRSREDLRQDKLFVFGRSLGAAVAIHLASETPASELAGLVIENSFTSVLDMIDKTFPFLTLFKGFCTNPWLNDEAITRVPEVPVLFLSGGMDEIVPSPMMKALFAACRNCNRTWEYFPKGTHNFTWKEEGYDEKVKEFFVKVLREIDDD